MPPIDENIRRFLLASGLVAAGEEPVLTPFSGGVASDIYRVDAGGRVFVVKKALSRLRVAQEWTVPISRNQSEVGWLMEARKVVPAAVPEILAHDAALGMFAMSYLDPQHHPVWKEELRQGRADTPFASSIGSVLAAIHSATADSPDIARRFANDDTFHAIRLEPYLEATARRHPDLADSLFDLSRKTQSCHIALVHGDVSPKNILAGPAGPIILDAECAWYGDPAFDVAFCLNHLLLKCIWIPATAPGYLACFDALYGSYLAAVDWEARDDIEARIARLLPALLLGRIDGKSPVEYIVEEADKAFARRIARDLLVSQPVRLAEIRHRWAEELEI